MSIADGRTLHVTFVALYLLALIAVGARKALKIKDQADFSLAGRGLSTFVLVGTLLATWIGTGSIFGNAGETYRVGVHAFILPVAGLAGIAVLFAMAARIRRFGQFTIQDILEARFGPAARVLGTLTLVAAYLIIVSYQYRAGAAVLGYLFEGISPTGFGPVAMVAVFVIAYTALAGMFSVAYTDVANGILMALGLLIAIPVLLMKTGGLGAAIDALPADQRTLFGPGSYDAWELVGVLLPSFLLLIGDANMVQRFFSARSPAEARRSAGLLLIGVGVLEFAILLVALLSSALVAQGKISPPENEGHLILHVAFVALGPALGALLVGTVLAVVVSTADSYLLSPSTSLVRDVYQRFVRPDAPERQVVLIGRLVVVGLGLVALYLSTLSQSFFKVALFAYTIYGAGITPAILAAYFWKRATKGGAIASIPTGVLVALGWKWLLANAASVDGPLGRLGTFGAEHGIDPILPAVVLSLVVLVVVSLLQAPPDREHSEAF